MATSSATPARRPLRAHEEEHLLRSIGSRVRARRETLGLSRRELAARARLSTRFLAQVESGEGNVAVTRLARIAGALGVTTAGLLREGVFGSGEKRLPILALVGLRGAGKSSLGQSVASELGIPFMEHDRLVEEEAGMSLGEIFAIHGESFYRDLARTVLERFLASDQAPAVLATSGGVVADEAAFALLRKRCHTVWLRAGPEEHWSRVTAQGDRRPMRDHPDAMAALRTLLGSREPLYSECDFHLDTTARNKGATARKLVELARAVIVASASS